MNKAMNFPEMMNAIHALIVAVSRAPPNELR
jgi:hypothetical protein